MLKLINTVSYSSILPIKTLHLFNSFPINKSALYGFCKVKLYVTQFQNLQIKVNEQEQQLKQLTDTYNLLKNMSNMTTFDYIRKFGKLIINSHEGFQSSAYKKQQEKLIESRNLLQRRIQESSQKWQEPRKKIIEVREECVEAFLEDLINFQTKLFHLVEKIRKIGTKNDKVKDIHEGIQLTHQLLLKNLAKQGALMFNPVKGVRFNPIQQQILEWKQKQQKQRQTILQKGHIKSCLRYGWKLKDKLMRKALVQLL